MVQGHLPLYGEPEASPDWSQASSLSAEEIVVVYHERTKHHYHLSFPKIPSRLDSHRKTESSHD